MPQTNELTYVSIKDFSPGISQNPGTNYPPGMAQEDSTFRCIANRIGALTPLPQRVVPFHMPHDEAATPSGGGYALVGIFVPPIALLPTVLAFNPDTFPEHELWIGNQWLQGGNRRHRLRRYRVYETPGTTADLIKDITSPTTDVTNVGNGMVFGSTRSNRATPTIPGVPVVIAMWTVGFTLAYLMEFPDDQAPTTNAEYDIFTNVFLLNFACHQGRVVAQEATAYDHGVNTATFMGENLIWSRVNDVTTANWNTATPQVFVPENPSGFAFLGPMSANELFAVKLHGGLYVTGDLSNPTVVTLPMVVGSEVSQTPVITDIGMVYGNGTSGIWVWPHGDTSTLLSPMMEPRFWMVDTNEFDSFGGNRYQFAVCDEWVMVPNNWVYDTRLKSWWRMEDITVAQIRNWTTMGHFIYGSESFYTNENDDPIHRWERNTPTLSYSWQSQPLWETIGNKVDIREITIRAVGEGSITITCTPENAEPEFVQFQINNTLPELERRNMRCQGANIAVKIESVGASEAPTVYECNLGYINAQPVPSYN